MVPGCLTIQKGSLYNCRQPKAEVAKRQTRYVQGVVLERVCEFKSRLRHHTVRKHGLALKMRSFWASFLFCAEAQTIGASYSAARSKLSASSLSSISSSPMSWGQP